MKVAILICDGGDGSAHLEWFKDVDHACDLASDDDYCESYGINEGSPEIIEVPDGWTPPGGFSDD